MMNQFNHNQAILLIFLINISGIFQGFMTPMSLAQSSRNSINNNSAIEQSEESNQERSLTTLEEVLLKENLAKLDQQAQTLLTEGKADEAFEIWDQILILAQSLPRIEEIKTLAKIGQIAWDNNRKVQVKNIDQRLETIALEKDNFDRETLTELGSAFATVRNKEKALNIYQLMLDQAISRNDILDQQNVLNMMGELYLNWLDYLGAAQTYEELLKIATDNNNSYDQFMYLEKLAYIYNQSFQTENALRIKQQIAQTYLENQELEKLTIIKIEIGTDYEILQQLENASQIYQEAFTLAWGIQQLSVAGDALQKLGNLYYKSGYLDYALQIYQELLKVEQHSYNYYGLMNTYDKMGDIYKEQNKFPQAINAFQEALEIAQSLQYQQAYFQSKIDNVYPNQSNINNDLNNNEEQILNQNTIIN